MLSSRSYCFIWFATFSWVERFFYIVISISCGSVEFIPWWELIVLNFFSLVRVCALFNVVRFVCSITIEGLIIRSIYFIFVFNRIERDWFFRKFIFVFRLPLKRNISAFLFDPWDNLFPHLRLVPWIVVFIWRIDISIRLIRIGF